MYVVFFLTNTAVAPRRSSSLPYATWLRDAVRTSAAHASQLTNVLLSVVVALCNVCPVVHSRIVHRIVHRWQGQPATTQGSARVALII